MPPHIECYHRRAPPLDQPLDVECVLHSLPEKSLRLLWSFGRRHTRTKTSNAGSRDHPDNAAPLRLPRSAPSSRRGLKLFSKPQKHATTAVWRGWAGRDNDINPTVLVVVPKKEVWMSSKQPIRSSSESTFRVLWLPHPPASCREFARELTAPVVTGIWTLASAGALTTQSGSCPRRNVLLERGNPPNTVRSRLTRCESHRQVVS